MPPLKILSQLTSILVAALLLAVAGCSKSDKAMGLESDANGYVCMTCQTKFYTSRDVFAFKCPQCGQGGPQEAMALKCPADQHVTIYPRVRRASACEKCGKPIEAGFIPGEADLKAWGATKKTAKEVGN